MGFPGGSVLKNLATNAGNVGFNPCSGKIPYATGQLSPHPTTRESLCVAKKTQCSRLLFSRSVVADSATPQTAAHQASLSFTTSQELAQTHVH